MRDKDILKQIDRYLNGELSEKEADQLWVEILKNPEYLQWLEIESSAREFFHDKDRGRSRNTTTTNHIESRSVETNNRPSLLLNYRYWLYGIAAVFAVVVSFQFLSVDRPALQGFVAGDISVEEMATTDIYRSTLDRVDVIDVEINRGFEAAISGRLNESHQIYQELLDNSASDTQHAVINFNYGILLYNQERYPEAAEAFKAAVEYEDLPEYVSEKGWWFLGQSFVLASDLPSARKAIDKVYTLDGRFKAEAQNLLDRIDNNLE